MATATENEIDTSRVVSWQYDRAYRFLRLLEAKEDVANMWVRDLWNKYYEAAFDLNQCGKFGLWLWGVMLGVSRPKFSDGAGGLVYVSDEVYRRVLIARFFWMNAIPSMTNAARYFSLLLDCGEGSSNPQYRVVIRDNYDMTMDVFFNWVRDAETQAVLDAPGIMCHPTGVRINSLLSGQDGYLGFDGYYSTGSAATRKPLQATDKNHWGYSV